MSETVIDDRGLSLAEAAVKYVLTRTARDAQFRWHMIGTETLARCLAAEANRASVEERTVERWLLDEIGKQKPEEPRELELQRELEAALDRRTPEERKSQSRPPKLQAVLDGLRHWRRLHVECGLAIDRAAIDELKDLLERLG